MDLIPPIIVTIVITCFLNRVINFLFKDDHPELRQAIIDADNERLIPRDAAAMTTDNTK